MNFSPTFERTFAFRIKSDSPNDYPVLVLQPCSIQFLPCFNPVMVQPRCHPALFIGLNLFVFCFFYSTETESRTLSVSSQGETEDDDVIIPPPGHQPISSQGVISIQTAASRLKDE